MNEFRFVFCRRSDGCVNSLYSFYEMSVKQVLIMNIYSRDWECRVAFVPKMRWWRCRGRGRGERRRGFFQSSLPLPRQSFLRKLCGFCVSLYKKAATVMLFIRSTKTTVSLKRSYQYHRVYILLLSFHCANNYSSQYVPIWLFSLYNELKAALWSTYVSDFLTQHVVTEYTTMSRW